MVHYYAALACLVPFALLATVATGIWHDGSQRHLVLGLFTSIYCVAVHTLLILFMIVTGRILKTTMRTRSLDPGFLAELNLFFAERSAYPVALLGAASITATAVLGHGRYIGVPTWIHELMAIAATLLNLFAVSSGYRTLRENQRLVDRVAAELDRLDRSGAPVAEEPPALAWGARGRWLIFGLAAWAPYLYWGLVVWRGRFAEVGPALPAACALASLFGMARAWRAGPTSGP